MNATELAFLSLDDARTLLDTGDVSSVELTAAQLERIAALDGQLNAYITVLRDAAMVEAAAADTRRQAGERGALLGVPLAVKDLFETAGVRTTAGARALADNVPTGDATVVQRLRAAGAVLLGKTNMMEFAYGYPHPDFGETRNPWDVTRTAGGSSGGSAAAVAAAMAYGALGSDTGGSIRSPAAYCGIVGLKATYGRVSRAGVVPLAWSLDHAGPLTRGVRDCAILFDAIAGHDPLDPASAVAPLTPTVGGLDQPFAGLRVGVVEELFTRYVQAGVRALAEAALVDLERLGVALERVELPHARDVGPVIMPIIQAEATSIHWPRLTTRPEDYSAALRENLLLGATVLAKDYLDAQRARRIMQMEVDAALTRVDVLVFPTQPIVGPLLDAYAVGDGAEEDVLDVEIGHTGLANLTGHPALSAPCGFTSAGLPVGLQFTGRWFDEATLLRLAHAYEAAHSWRARRPPLVVP
jgi:aspartyl-tRNA(Asn)/glutamyl-tRNA(Gln) amidotransferase subunit A